MITSDRRVREIFIELTDTLVVDFDVIEFLDRLARRCTEVLDVTACGILLVDHNGRLNLVAASTEQARLLELAQLQTSEGPCVDAFHTGRPVQCADLAGDDRWPRFTDAAIAAGFGAVHALPMRLRSEILGAVNLFGEAAGPLRPETLELAQAMAGAATIGIVHQRALAHQEVVSEQLQAALNSRIAIEQAKGFLTHRLGVEVDQAFVVLRDHARASNRKLTDVATDVVTGRIDLATDQPGPVI